MFKFLNFKNSFQIIAFLVLSSMFLVVNPAFAQEDASLRSSPINSYAIPNTNPSVPKNLHTWTQSVMIEVMSTMVCQLSGIDPVNPNQKCLGVDQKTGKIGFMEGGGGAIGVTGNMIAMLYTPPLHTGDYFNYLAQNFGFAKPAYAQGAGFVGLKPVMSLWVAFRNIVYLLFVIVFVIIGLAIMLRIKIDPRTVMSVQNQIPKIIVSIVFITFSFAIAGFLIDMMYVTIYLSTNVVTKAVSPSANLTAKVTDKLNSSPVAFFNDLYSNDQVEGGVLKTTFETTNAALSIINSIFFGDNAKRAQELFQQPWGDPKKNCGFLGIGCISPAEFINRVTDTVLTLALGIVSGLISVIIGILGILIILIALLWSLIRLWFALLAAYVWILIDVVIAPFYIVLGLFPGSPLGFGTWFRDIIANLSVFPVTIAMFLLGKVFMDQFSAGNASTQFVPPLIGNPGSLQAVGYIIGFAIVLITPQVMTMMRDYLKAPQFKYMSAVGQAVGTAAGVPFATGKGIGSTILAGQEWVPTGAAGLWGQRGNWRAALGRLLGRG